MADLTVMTANFRLPLARDRGRLSWLLRRRRVVHRLRRHNPDVILCQELDEDGTRYVATKLGMSVYKPTAGNRPVLYRPDVLTLVRGQHTDLGDRCYSHAALLSGRDGAAAWYVSVHLEARDAALRGRQMRALGAWLPTLPGPAVVGGDFNQRAVSLPGFGDVRAIAPSIANADADSAHGWDAQAFRGRWIDQIHVRDVAVRWVRLELTSAADESDHSWPSAGITTGA